MKEKTKKIDICSHCGKERFIVNRTHKLCGDCNFKRLHNGLTKLQYKILQNKFKPKVKRKPTGELDLFKEIWAERPHICVKCGKRLGETLKPIFFSHIKSKGAYPELRLVKTNIELVCADCHHEYEFGSRKNLEQQ